MAKTKKDKGKSKRNYKLIIRAELLILAVCFVIGAFRIYQTVPAVRDAVALATTIRPETFTELYFENHNNLPRSIEYYKDYDFKFTIHNLEYKTMNYSYEVYIKCVNIGCNGEKQIIDEGNVTLKQNEFKTINESYNIIFPTGRVEVIINLINKKQQIDFWIGEPQ
jgi:hypothetical protein